MGSFSSLELVDHHCHSVALSNLTFEDFLSLGTESDWLSEDESETLDNPFGLALRTLCAPILNLEKHSSIFDYYNRPNDIGSREVAKIFLGKTGVKALFIDTGFSGEGYATFEDLREFAACGVEEVIRIETLAESILSEVNAKDFIKTFQDKINQVSTNAIGFKTVVAYRFGLDLPASPPAINHVQNAVDEWYKIFETKGISRINHPIVLFHLIWEAVRVGKPIQFHVGFGDSDVELWRADPSRLTPFLRATRESGTKIVLLHSYPFIRESAILAYTFPHVYFDIGEVSHHTGFSSIRTLEQALELAPFHKLLYSSDAVGLPEHYFVSSTLWRRNIENVMDRWLSQEYLSIAEVEKITYQISALVMLRNYIGIQ